MKLDVRMVERRLFDCAKDRICADYGLDVPNSADELSFSVRKTLDQHVVEDPLNQSISNDTVLLAATRALASNSRKWSVYLRNQDAISKLLSYFSVADIARDPPTANALSVLLPGQTSNRDSCSILRWITVLAENADYYQSIVGVAKELIERSSQLGTTISQYEVFLCVVECCSNPPIGRPNSKWPGMRFALGSEFLRNLGWSGFKPDRHIKRLVKLWIPELVDDNSALHDRAIALTNIIGNRNRDLIENLVFSLAGIQISPNNYSYSETDNLIWLLGAYVEKKGRESRVRYIDHCNEPTP
jgi:hypothetical protein